MNDNNHIAQLHTGLATAFIDQSINSNLAYKPQFVSNDYRNGRTVLSAIEHELKHCDSFVFSVAFITRGGLTPLLQTLSELEKKGICGKILTTDYLTFNDPCALEKLHNLKNVELKMFTTEGESEGFHTKGYIFKKGEMYRMIVGSSNMTDKALKANREWNMKLVGHENGQVIKDVLKEFHMLWDNPRSLWYEDFIEDYRRRFEIAKNQKQIAASQEVVALDAYRLQPNVMQSHFVENLVKLREEKQKKALLISATGTGKTYASAFGLREMAPKRALFLVHREQIAKQAMASYKRVFGKISPSGEAYQYALLSGNTSSKLEEIKKADFVFATMQMMSKEEIRATFPRDAFDVICLDEAHHAGAASYQKIMGYFTPSFWLGMTATPESNYYDVYDIFDHNIAYEIRLQQALEESLLCPFHYFGITDLMVDGQVIGDDTKQDGLADFRYLVSDARVDYIIKQSEYYGYSGDRLKGLVFCSRKNEAKELSAKFNARGYRTEVLTGEDHEARREALIERLVKDAEGEQDDYLDLIFSISVLEEGSDIPEVNQVIMLRPTESPIVFIQQLGRGLRKAREKEFVVVLDFIGNYRKNFYIPIALSGDRSYNKDNVRRYVMEGDRVIPGVSTIHFDEISKKRIFESIDTANFSDIKLIKDNYTNLKHKLGRIPRLRDFDDYGEMDVCRIFDNGSLGSYYRFLEKYEKDFTVRLSEDEATVLEFVSKKLAAGKRVHELRLLKRMMYYGEGILKGLGEDLQQDYDIALDEFARQNVVNVMTQVFASGTGRSTYERCIFLEEDGEDYRISKPLELMLLHKEFFKLLEELVDFGIHRYETGYKECYGDTSFVLYQKYTYEDVCRLLNWANNEVPINIGGYKYDKRTKTFPVFINYDKSDDISETTKYEDRFVDASTLVAISKSGRSLASEDVQNFLHARERDIDVHLFVRKNKDDKISKEFYYLGHMEAAQQAEEFVMPNTAKTAVKITWNLETPVREDIYQYIVS